MRSSNQERLEREYADELERRYEEIKKNPLAFYSTSELKAELRRRKKEGY